MKEFFHSGKFKILIFIFSLLLGVMIYTAVNFGGASLPETILKTITQPFVSLANNVSTWTEENIEKIVNANKYKQENEELREKLTSMYEQIKDMDDLQKENAQLKQMLDIAEEHDDFAWSPPCNIISREAIDIFKSFTIDRGADDGIKRGDPVITNIGLVGIISEVSPTFAKVTTLLSTDISVGVMTVDKRIVGLIENEIEFAEQQLCRMSYIEKDSDIQVGDVVVTSGGSVYPAGLIAGEVTSIYPDSNGLTLHAVVQPSVDVAKITDCFVITAFKGQGVTME